jgi:hypothetical protein
MSVKAKPLHDLSAAMANCVARMREGMTLRVDKSVRTWTYFCGEFGHDRGFRTIRFPITNQTFRSLLNRGLLEYLYEHEKRHFYGLRKEFNLDKPIKQD